MNVKFDRRRSLEELEQNDWGEPSFNSHLVTTIYRLRLKPLCDFTPEDLRIMIGQSISPDYLIPIALEQLEIDPLIAGDLYPGDLLNTVVRLDSEYWQQHPDFVPRLAAIVYAAISCLEQHPELPKHLLQSVLAFKARLRSGQYENLPLQDE
jgi:hypothetical protein